eukprot:30938-Pelagococcus_subviridis.AAC.6
MSRFECARKSRRFFIFEQSGKNVMKLSFNRKTSSAVERRERRKVRMNRRRVEEPSVPEVQGDGVIRRVP